MKQGAKIYFDDVSKEIYQKAIDFMTKLWKEMQTSQCLTDKIS